MESKDKVLITSEVPTNAADNHPTYVVGQNVDPPLERKLTCCLCNGDKGTLIGTDDNTGRYVHSIRTICDMYKRGDVPDNLHIPNRAERRSGNIKLAPITYTKGTGKSHDDQKKTTTRTLRVRRQLHNTKIQTAASKQTSTRTKSKRPNRKHGNIPLQFRPQVMSHASD